MWSEMEAGVELGAWNSILRGGGFPLGGDNINVILSLGGGTGAVIPIITAPFY